MQHLHVAYGPVGGLQKAADGLRRHVDQDDLDEKGQQGVLEAPQHDVERAPDMEVASEYALTQFPAPFR